MTKKLTDNLLAELERWAEKSIPAPWQAKKAVVGNDYGIRAPDSSTGIFAEFYEVCLLPLQFNPELSEANARFVVLARELVPLMIEEIRRLRKSVDAAVIEGERREAAMESRVLATEAKLAQSNGGEQ